MTELYHPKSRAVREIKEDDPSREVKLNALKRAGFLVGELPPKKNALPLEAEKEVLPATEGEEQVDSTVGKEPVLAKHAPIEASQEEENPFAEKGIKELRKIAKEKGIVIPSPVRSKKAIAEFLHSKLDLVDEEEDDDAGE